MTPGIRFSIIITSYNQREFIKEAVDSALSLGYKPAEIIVVDDGSSDGSQDLLRQHGDAIRLVCLEKNQGASAALNRGALLATGDYLVFLDGDDAFLPWCLDVYARIAEAKQPKLILGFMRWFEGPLPAILPEEVPHEIRMVGYGDFLQKDRSYEKSSSALVVDRQVFQSVQGWPTATWPLNDLHFLLRLCVCGQAVQVLTPFTTLRRSHAYNSVKSIPPFLLSLHALIERERSGEFPGGKQRRFERHALMGGSILHWAMKAVKVGLYGGALKLLARGWPMVCEAAMHRCGSVLKGRQSCETIKM